MTDVLIKNTQQLIQYFQQGEKHPNFVAIGTEHEQFLFDRATKARVPYEGEQGIGALLKDFIAEGWNPILEEGQPIALSYPGTMRTISLEPGGQFELSGMPVRTLHQEYDQVTAYLHQLDRFLKYKNIERVGLGFDPLSRRQDVPWMPKKRYQIMREYMPQKGAHGLDMMTRTCTIQVNLDYIDETDFVQKMRVAMALQPVIGALFANSSMVEGKDSGYKSYRNYIWLNTDPDRCGLLPFVFEEDMSYARYVEYLLDVPMYYINRNGEMLLSGQPFRNFLNKKLAVAPGQTPTMADWVQQISMVFPEVRLKQFLELRTADCGSDPMIMALSAVWVGLLYDSKNLKTCHEYIQTLSFDDIKHVYETVPKGGLTTLLQQKPIGSLARQLIVKSRAGLKRRQNFNEKGQDESIYLDPLFAILEKAGF